MDKKDFRRYWKAGFLFLVISSLINSALGYVSSLFSSLPVQTINLAGSINVTILEQPEWTVIIILFAAAVVTVMPWVYGRLIEVFHNEFITEKKTGEKRHLSRRESDK